MNWGLCAALVAAILVFAWSLVRVAALSDRRSRERAAEEWYLVEASEAALRRVRNGGQCPTIDGVSMVSQGTGMSLCVGPAGAGVAWREPRERDRPVVWLLPGHSAEPGYLQEELARLKRAGAIRNYYRVVAYPGGAVDYRA